MDVLQLVELLAARGPWAVVALLALALAWERRENRALQKDLMALATAQAQAILKQEMTLAGLKELLVAFIHRER